MENSDLLQKTIPFLNLVVIYFGFIIFIYALPAIFNFLTRRVLRWRRHRFIISLFQSANLPVPPNVKIVGFFHPYCDAGGGGERVLWCAIKAVQSRYPDAVCIVYTGDRGRTSEQILSKSFERFSIKLPQSKSPHIHFVYLQSRFLVEASSWPRFTLMGQSVGSVVLGIEALLRCPPDVYIDTMGYAFTFSIFKHWGGAKVGCYVHYPTISTDMLDAVARSESAFNNSGVVARSRLLTRAKLFYYQLFATLYGNAGRNASLVLVNSHWTLAHINRIWRVPRRTRVIFPPCDLSLFENVFRIKQDDDKASTDIPTLATDSSGTNSHKFDISEPSRAVNSELAADRPAPNEFGILSIAQFRPEKNHQLQLQCFKVFLDLSETKRSLSVLQPTLYLVGGCRNDEDLKRVQQLREQAKQLGIESHVQFVLDAPNDELKRLMRRCVVGLHTMRNEHFGIGIVECMSAGLITLANNSGGPRTDIVVDPDVLDSATRDANPTPPERTGFLATAASDYACELVRIAHLTREERVALRERARASVRRFDQRSFEKQFLDALTASRLMEP